MCDCRKCVVTPREVGVAKHAVNVELVLCEKVTPFRDLDSLSAALLNASGNRPYALICVGILISIVGFCT